MKKLFYSISVVAVILMTIVSCKSNLSATKSRPQQMAVTDTGYGQVLDRNTTQASKTTKTNSDVPSNLSLADLIRKTAGVYVTGEGDNAKVRVSGISSFGATDPLFVINGTAVGNDFRHAQSLVNPNDVKSITVLKGNDATIYGSRGANGVVVIRTN